MKKFRPLKIGNLEIVIPDLEIRKAEFTDLEKKRKFLRPGEEFSDEPIRNYILGLRKFGIIRNLMKEYGCPNIIGIEVIVDFGGSRGKTLYIDEPIDIDLFIAGEAVSAYDSSGEEHEVYMGSPQVLDWSAEEGKSLFVVRKIK